MIKINILIALIFLLAGCSAPAKDDFISRSMDAAKQQALLMAEYMARYPDRLPRTYDQKLDSIYIADSKHWVSGFYPGVLWYLNEYHKDKKLKDIAVNFLSRVEQEKYNTYDHDIGFQIYCSFGNAFRLTGDKTFKDVILTAAHSATKRYQRKDWPDPFLGFWQRQMAISGYYRQYDEPGTLDAGFSSYRRFTLLSCGCKPCR
jgi:unsaturated chondroitin disaccharide hydrolase